MAAFLRVAGIAMCFCPLAAAAIAQPAQAGSKILAPDSGYLSPDQYTNAFFGFSLPLPIDVPLEHLSMPSPGAGYFLFGGQTQKDGLTILTVRATPSHTMSAEEAREQSRAVASGPAHQQVKPLQIGGKGFWESDALEQGPSGKVRAVRYTTSLDGYLLEFVLLSFNPELTEKFRRSIQSLKFFDPQNAAAVAGTRAQPYPPAAPVIASLEKPEKEQLSQGTVLRDTYTNPTLGFDFRMPPGWVMGNEATQIEPGHLALWADGSAGKKQYAQARACTQTLLWVTKYPEGSAHNEFNPLIALMATDTACLRGLKFPVSATDVKGIRKASSKVLQSFAGAPYIAEDPADAGTTTVQGHLLMRSLGGSLLTLPGNAEAQATVTCFLFTQIKNYIVAWRYMSGDRSTMQQMFKDTGILFTTAESPPSGSPGK